VNTAIYLFLDPENLSLSTRYTQDVDLIVDIKTTTQWYELDEKVRKLGFKNYQSSDPFEKNTDFTCRYQLGEDLIVDFMPTDEKILGFSNSWYLEAYKKKVEYKLGNNLIINTLMPEYFLATKFEAFHGRKEIRAGRTSGTDHPHQIQRFGRPKFRCVPDPRHQFQAGRRSE
jgi:hypothetical protein